MSSQAFLDGYLSKEAADSAAELTPLATQQAQSQLASGSQRMHSAAERQNTLGLAGLSGGILLGGAARYGIPGAIAGAAGGALLNQLPSATKAEEGAGRKNRIKRALMGALGGGIAGGVLGSAAGLATLR